MSALIIGMYLIHRLVTKGNHHVDLKGVKYLLSSAPCDVSVQCKAGTHTGFLQ